MKKLKVELSARDVYELMRWKNAYDRDMNSRPNYNASPAEKAVALGDAELLATRLLREAMEQGFTPV